MGGLLGIPEWLAVTLWIVIALTMLCIWGMAHIRKAHRRLLARRPNPTEALFLSLMAEDVHPQTAKFLWDKALSYVKPTLAPHPEDHLSQDLKIDDDDWGMDWPRDFAELKGFHESNFPDWPEGWPTTVRNLGRWLDMGPA